MFINCVRLTNFNGLRGRLYALQDDGRWQVRVLGKNQGQFVLVHPKNLQIDVDQRAFVVKRHLTRLDNSSVSHVIGRPRSGP